MFLIQFQVQQFLHVRRSELPLELLDHCVPSIFYDVLIPLFQLHGYLAPGVPVLDLTLQDIDVLVERPISFL